MKTKQEIRNFLESQVGKKVNAKAGALNGQCVTLIKALMEFLGVQDPYKARGNAKDAGDRYIAEGIGKEGRGWLTVVVNRSMGGGYGHIWVDLLNEQNYEQNGAKALLTTKGTRPISQAQQFVNFDQWVKPDPKPQPKPEPKPPVDNSIKVGDTVVPTRLVDYNGTHLKQWDKTYTVTQVKGDRAVLSARGAVWAAMNVKDIKKV